VVIAFPRSGMEYGGQEKQFGGSAVLDTIARTTGPAAGIAGEWTDAEQAMIDRAAALAPVLRKRAAEAETLRRIPDETEEDFRAAGFYRIYQPARFGGYEMRYGLHTMLAAQAARGCGSSGWVLSVIACHSWILGMFEEKAQADIWDRDPECRIASSFLAADAKAEPADGGVKLNGKWRFSSNVVHCGAIMLQIMVPQKSVEGVPPLKQYFALLTRDQYETEDNWNVVGLAATGSNDVIVQDAFVPQHRLLDIMTTRDAQSPGSKVNAHPLYNMPLFAPFAHSLVGAALGSALGALEQVTADLADKRSVANVKLAEQPAIQMRIGEATAQINAAFALMAADRGEINRMAAAKELPDYETRARWRLNTGYATKLCVQVLEHLLPVTGGRGLELSSPVQRAWRDVHAVAQHIALTWDIQTSTYGAVRLGGRAFDPRL
jgi:alkylation response protein AidB-like acyl-CoA dehydrogenase